MTEEKKEYIPVYWDALGAYLTPYGSEEWKKLSDSDNENLKCQRDIYNECQKNFDGKKLDTSFVPGLIEKYGLERIKYILATMTKNNDSNRAFDKTNRMWLSDVPISNDMRGQDRILFALNPITDKLDTMATAVRTYEKEKYGLADFETAKNTDGSVSVTMPKTVQIKNVGLTSVGELCVMPHNRGVDTFKFVIPDLKENCENNRDDTITATLCTNRDHTLKIWRKGEEKMLSADEVLNIFSGAKAEDYTPKTCRVEVPNAATRQTRPGDIAVMLPSPTRKDGQIVCLDTKYRNNELSSADKIVFDLPDYEAFPVQDKKGRDTYESLSSAEVAKETEKYSFLTRGKGHTNVNRTPVSKSNEVYAR